MTQSDRYDTLNTSYASMQKYVQLLFISVDLKIAYCIVSNLTDTRKIIIFANVHYNQNTQKLLGFEVSDKLEHTFTYAHTSQWTCYSVINTWYIFVSVLIHIQ